MLFNNRWLYSTCMLSELVVTICSWKLDNVMCTAWLCDMVHDLLETHDYKTIINKTCIASNLFSNYSPYYVLLLTRVPERYSHHINPIHYGPMRNCITLITYTTSAQDIFFISRVIVSDKLTLIALITWVAPTLIRSKSWQSDDAHGYWRWIRRTVFGIDFWRRNRNRYTL